MMNATCRRFNYKTVRNAVFGMDNYVFQICARRTSLKSILYFQEK
jgi:hypothetical protein